MQKELAALLGVASGTKVSRHESFVRQPSVTAIFAYEIIFGTPASELFAGRYDTVRNAVRERAKILLEALRKEPIRGPNAAKIQFLERLVDPNQNPLQNAS